MLYREQVRARGAKTKPASARWVKGWFQSTSEVHDCTRERQLLALRGGARIAKVLRCSG
jgi:hypothetical protein